MKGVHFIPVLFNNVQFMPPNYTVVHTDGGTLDSKKKMKFSPTQAG